MTDKQIAELKDCGRLQYTIKETAILIGMPVKDLQAEMKKKKEAYLAYHAGRLSADKDVRESMISLAQSGSSEAQKMFLKLRDEIKLEELE